MTRASALLAAFLGTAACAAGENDCKPVLACNLGAISSTARPRYKELVKRIRAGMRSRSEIPNGYAFKLDGKAVTLTETAEWITMERLCCPFLTLQLSAAGDQEDWILTLTGPEGVKPFLDLEFPIQQGHKG